MAVNQLLLCANKIPFSQSFKHFKYHVHKPVIYGKIHLWKMGWIQKKNKKKKTALPYKITECQCIKKKILTQNIPRQTVS